MRKRLAGLSTVVTGASAGLGRAIARAFATEGANVGLIARGLDGLDAAASEVRGGGTQALVLPCDVADAKAVEVAAERVVDAWGALDVWVNDAMISVFSPVAQMHPDEYRRVTEVNYLGYVHGTLAALRHMRARDRGLIVQIGSARAYRSIPLQSAYCATKAAIRGFSDSLRSELYHEHSHVRVSMLQLPAMNTPQFEVVRSRLPRHPYPVPPIYQPEVIAQVVVWSVLHPRRELRIGWSTTQAILGQRFMPGLLDRYLATAAWDGQMTDQLPRGHPHRHRRDSLDAPLPGDRGAHGPFDAQARSFSTKAWARTHPAWIAVAGLALAAGAAAWSVRRRR